MQIEVDTVLFYFSTYQNKHKVAFLIYMYIQYNACLFVRTLHSPLTQ